jgi:AP endonuclease-1
MPRRSSKRTEIEISEIESSEAVITPKKGRGAVEVETQTVENWTGKVEITTKTEKSSKPRILPELKLEIDSDEELLATPKKSLAKSKVNGITPDQLSNLEADSKPKKALAKRKVKIEDNDDDTEEKKAPKKRKTKEEKEAEAMPLAARALIGSLKQAMYIGAHVSGAGGKFLYILGDTFLIGRCT